MTKIASCSPSLVLRMSAAGIVISIAAGSALAADPWKPEGNDCNQKSTTVDIVDCIQGRTKFWDTRLNQAWKVLNAALAAEPPRLAALKTAQLAWIKYRDANCAYYYSGDGTFKQVETAQCLLDMTQSRAIELHGEAPQ